MKKLLSLLLLVAVAATSLFAEEDIKFTGWKQAETEHFRFIYEDASKEAAEMYAEIADDAWNKIAKIYACPQDKIDVTVTARTNTVNAFTYFSPLSIGMFNTPLYTPKFTYRTNWKQLFFTHELIHAANAKFEDDRTTRIFENIFGSFVTSLNINLNVPGWALEGLTTVLETELTEGGRGRSPYFELEYKAPTLDNAFMSFTDVGKEAEPPYGQSYVIGYLMMRSIADRWGIEALADIERNRKNANSWEDSVLLVTGHTAQEIYTDVRISLAKKYAEERKIPEGIIISPREVGTYYYKPAIVDDEGNIITLRGIKGEKTAVVKLTPSAKRGSNFIQKTKPEEDLNTVFKETVLFTGNFQNESCITASLDGTVYGTLAEARLDAMPGYSIENYLFKWTQEKGLEKLSKKADIFQPTVSRDGKTLVAIEAHNVNMRLVKIDVETGDIIPILEQKGIDFIEPSLNADGTKLAFLAADGKRAEVCVLDMNNIASGYKVIYNGEGKITDPSSPSWNSDGKLLFTDNSRGRLETFEVTEEDGTYKIIPVVADPIGVLWAYKTEKGIFYHSHSSTGDVIKIKPAEEWGKVPETEGPSPAGEIICFGKLQNDYADFKPYEIPSERIITEEEKKADEEKAKAKLKSAEKDDKNKEPIPVKGKYIQKREEEFVKKADEANAVQTTLLNEKAYVPLPKRLISIPLAVPVTVSGKTEWGFGVDMLLIIPSMQMMTSIGIAGFTYYPTLNNFTGSYGVEYPLGGSLIDFMCIRALDSYELNGQNINTEVTGLFLGAICPFYHKVMNDGEYYFSVLGGINSGLKRTSTSKIAVNSKTTNTLILKQDAGIEFCSVSTKYDNSQNLFDATLLQIGYLDDANKKYYVGVEAEASNKFSFNKINAFEVSLRGRYADFPVNAAFGMTRAQYFSEEENYLYPGSAVARVALLNQSLKPISLRTYYEWGCKFGTNTVDGNTPVNNNPLNLTINDLGLVGFEIEIGSGNMSFVEGISIPVDNITSLEDVKFYETFRINWDRGYSTGWTW